ncbi:MAG: Fic family protein [Gemmatimonadota bacterium]
MADWDADSDQLRSNIGLVSEEVRQSAIRRDPPALAMLRQWHRILMRGLETPDPFFVGRFRGEVGMSDIEVFVLGRAGVRAWSVGSELTRFAHQLAGIFDVLDNRIPPGSEAPVELHDAITEACGWAHSEWVRVHAFRNGNGRIARLLVVWIAARYGLPPFVNVRPRPDGDYAAAAAAGMDGDHKPTARLFDRLLDEYLERQDSRDE